MNEETRPNPEAAERTDVDGALSLWDPWLVTMYLDALRAAQSEKAPTLH